MNKDQSNMSPSKSSASKTIWAAFEILKKNGGEMQRKLLLDEVNNKVIFEPWEKERYDSNGQLKWLTIFLFYTIDCIKAGWLTKNKGVWFLTPEGEKAMNLGAVGMIDAAGKAYREWRSSEAKDNPKHTDDKDPDIRALLRRKILRLYLGWTSTAYPKIILSSLPVHIA